MDLKLPQNKWLLIVFLNLIWWAVPLGFSHELFKNLSYYAPDPNADSLGIIIFPLFGLWFVLWIGLNIVLFIIIALLSRRSISSRVELKSKNSVATFYHHVPSFSSSLRFDDFYPSLIRSRAPSCFVGNISAAASLLDCVSLFSNAAGCPRMR
jgi:hypothetical protein